MEGIEGWRAIEWLKNDERTNDIPVIVMTNLDQRLEIEKGIKLGVARYLIFTQHTPNEAIKVFKVFLSILKN